MRKLNVGDVIIVSTMLSKTREYVVKKIVGNKAITDFRKFNRKVFDDGSVYEHGKGWTENGYWLKKD